MKLVAVDPRELDRFAKEFTRRHQGWLVTVEERAPGLGEDDFELRMPAEEALFRALRWEPAAPRLVVEFGDDASGAACHAVERPAAVERASGERGSVVEVRIEHTDGAFTRLHMRPDRDS